MAAVEHADAASNGDQDPTSSGPTATVAELIEPLVHSLLGEITVELVFWDGSSIGAPNPAGRIFVRSQNALQRIVWAPDELGLGRAYVAGEIDFEGDIFALIKALRPAGRAIHKGLRALPAVLTAAQKLDLFHLPPEAPQTEARVKGWRHSKRRDASDISHHYDVGNDFYRLILGPSLTYSCARFAEPGMTLAEAQASKHELICRKLGLHEKPDQRLLDVGCGWGSMAMHAALEHQANVVGVTISQEQAELAQQRVAEAGLSERVEIRLQDYRDLRGETFDAISSIGMFEHVGKVHMAKYFRILNDLLRPTGRLLNHAISSVGGSKLGNRSFVYRYVFPDGELIDVGNVVQAMESSGFEVRDVESLREHYAETLRHWVANLEAHHDEATSLVGEERTRVWHLYMAASAVGFEDGGLGVHQVLGVKPSAEGESGMARTRHDFAS